MNYPSLLMSPLLACPPLGRLMLRGCLRAIGGEPASASWAVHAMLRRLVPTRPIQVVRVGRGARLEVDLSSAMGREVYYFGSTGPEVAGLLRRILRPGMTFVDAGANMGEFTVRAAGRVGPSGRVVALEASPTTAAHLRRNVSLNRVKNVRIVEAAVFDHDGPQTFHLGRGPDSGSSSLSRPHDHSGESIRVEGVTLDTLARSEALDRVDCIKLDVEGAELPALRGAVGLLAGSWPPLVILEYHPTVSSRAGWSLDDLRDFLEGFDYQLHVVDRNGVGSRLDRTPDRVCNLAAVPRRRAESLADRDA